MNPNNVGIFLMAAALGTANLMLFIYLGNRFLKLLEAQDLFRVPVKRSSPGNMRRRVEHKPGIICSLPIHQQGRYEAPLPR